MLGNPKYEKGELVSFEITDRDGTKSIITGEVYIIDKWGTFEQQEEVSYDIMAHNVNGERCLYKHIPENEVFREHHSGRQQASVKGTIEITEDGEIPRISFRVIGNRRERMDHIFIIKQGVLLSAEMEKLFIDYCGSCWIELDAEELDKVYECFSSKYPEMNLIRYEKGKHMLAHIYYVLNTRGVREILFKANLDLIGTNLESINEYNLIGTSPEEIFDGLPIKALRSLNASYKTLRLMESELQRCTLCEVYKHFGGKIDDWNLTDIQWKYLIKKYYSGENIDKKTLSFVKTLYWDSDLAELLDYQDKVDAIAEYVTLPKVPFLNDEGEYECYDVANGIFYTCVLHKQYYDRRLEQQYKEGGHFLEGSDNQYTIVLPKTVKAICEEGNAMKNCLTTYIQKLASRYTLVLFLKEVASGTTIAHIEIDEHMNIVQAFGRQNSSLSKDIEGWIEHYLSKKKEKYADIIESLFQERKYY